MAVVGIVFRVLASTTKPYKSTLDNTPKITTEQHGVVIAAIAGAIMSDDDDKIGKERSKTKKEFAELDSDA